MERRSLSKSNGRSNQSWRSLCFGSANYVKEQQRDFASALRSEKSRRCSREDKRPLAGVAGEGGVPEVGSGGLGAPILAFSLVEWC